MRLIDKYIEVMTNCDYKGLSELFAKDGSICDYCTNIANRSEYHIYGQPAIDMFFRNKFTFREYIVSEAEAVNDEQAEFIASFQGYNVMAIATIRKVSEDGKIERLTVRPK